MREIKFRAWDTTRKKMFSAEEMGRDDLTISVHGRGFVNVSGASPSLSHFLPHLIPEQFTGLRDKKGKEIYEGDILALGTPIVWQVLWKDSPAGFFASGEMVDIPLDEIFCVRSDVVGTIHENPELLEAKP